MAWPSGSDYQGAVQTPQNAFQDPELQACTTRIGNMGMPWVASGRFASVYCLEHPSGQKYAVRVFNRHVTTQKDRYQAVSDHLGGVVLQFMVGFQYTDQGIQVTGQWCPMIKMEWVDGMAFGRFVEDNANNPSALLFSAGQFRGIVGSLQGLTMSHCDLQHDNIMVTPNFDLKLVDYDDFFVPALAGENALADGMPNYQHPARTGNNFNEQVDNFSALVIYMSLGALAADPSLFTKYNNGDNLVLKEADYKDLNSPVWLDLAHSKNKIVADLTDIVRQACQGPIGQVPTLESALKQTGALAPGTRPAVAAPQPRTQPTVVPPTMAPRPTVVLPTPPPPPPQPMPRIALPATSLTFAATRVGTPATGTFVIQNSGTGDLHLTSVSVVSGPFAVAPLTSTTVTPNGPAITVTMQFTPAVRGPVAGSVEIRSDDPNNRVLAVTLSGRGLAPEISVSWPGQPGAINFGQVRVGSASAPRSIIIRNIGDADLGNISITGPQNISVGQYAATLAAGAFQDVELVFTPAAEGSIQGQITITSDDPGPGKSLITITLTGEGVVPPPVKKCIRCGDINPHTAARCRCGNYLRSWRNYELLRP